MSPFAFFLALLPIGLVTGWAVGAGLTFTGGRRRVDLLAGLSGAILVALPLHLLGPPGYMRSLAMSLSAWRSVHPVHATAVAGR